MTDPEREELLHILSHPKHIPGQKCIILCLLLNPNGLTLYQIMDIMYAGKAYHNRRAIQRLLEYPLHTGAIIKIPFRRHDGKGKVGPDTYVLGART